MRFEAKLGEFGVLRVVVMRFGFDTRVGLVFNLHFETHLPGNRLDVFGEIEHRKLFRELIEDAELTFLGRVKAGKLHAADRIADIEEAAGLTAAPIHAERHADGCLGAEPVQHGTEDLVVVEAVD